MLKRKVLLPIKLLLEQLAISSWYLFEFITSMKVFASFNISLLIGVWIPSCNAVLFFLLHTLYRSKVSIYFSFLFSYHHFYWNFQNLVCILQLIHMENLLLLISCPSNYGGDHMKLVMLLLLLVPRTLTKVITKVIIIYFLLL